eukprot:Polyplicarium_translucidae@DN4027_c0_g1_i1.p1
MRMMSRHDAYTHSLADEFFKALDTEERDSLSFLDFCALLDALETKPRLRVPMVEVIDDVFEALDVDRDGRLSVDDFQGIVDFQNETALIEVADVRKAHTFDTEELKNFLRDMTESYNLEATRDQFKSWVLAAEAEVELASQFNDESALAIRSLHF